MSRILTYADALAVLGEHDSRALRALDRLSGGILVGAAVTFPGLLGLLDARAEFIRQCHGLLQKVSEQRTGVRRLDRTDRLSAAHTVIVVTAFFEALDALGLPLTVADLELDRREELRLAQGEAPADAEGFASTIMSAAGVVPSPEGAAEEFEDELRRYYSRLADRLARFVGGLAVRDRLPERDWDAFVGGLADLPQASVRRYTALLRQLAAAFPEVALWVSLREHRATRAAIRESLQPSLRQLSDLLAAMSSGRVPPARLAALSRAYGAWLEEPMIALDELPKGMQVPALADAYLPPLFRAAGNQGGLAAGDEDRWSAVPVRDDLDAFLAVHLTSPQAARAPVLILGQPGAGKSALCRVLAARLPPADFLPVLVSLRDVAAFATIQEQIEHAIRDATGERAEWAQIARSADGALPVVLLDGFDELLQATGISQSDYLIKAAEFQRREAAQGRAVCVIVTSRTSVADRARTPADTMLLRLEPFDAERISAWLSAWNTANGEYFDTHGWLPLPPAAVLRYPQLAEQPLLLLMLALYDADGNALQQRWSEYDDPLSHGELYERLLYRFAEREVAKLHPGLTDDRLRLAVEDELRRLSLVAFAMLNRGAQWVSQSELEADFIGMLGRADMAAQAGDRSPLRPSERILGRFFFVHRTQAVRDNDLPATFEFLHSTIGEYLVARLTWQVVKDAAAMAAASTLPMTRAGHGLLYALLSFAALSVRTPTVWFLAGLARRLDAPTRARIVRTLLDLFATAGRPQAAGEHSGYEPRELTVAGRQAAYSANLLLLIVITSGAVSASQLYGRTSDAVDRWRSDALLWHGQLSIDEWDSLVRVLAVHRMRAEDGSRDVRLMLDDGSFAVPPADAYWTWKLPTDRRDLFMATGLLDYTRRRAHFECGVNNDILELIVAPLRDTPLANAVTTVVAAPHGGGSTAVNTMVETWLLPLRDVPESQRAEHYRRGVEIACHSLAGWTADMAVACTTVVLGALAVDQRASAVLVAGLLDEILRSFPYDRSALAGPVAACAAAALCRTPPDGPEARRLTELVRVSGRDCDAG